ncbi:uncharacterized protein LOC123500024 isoform X2 [Portunus trituberculatus]|uniref:uncharacterized protein LOC123500024 isoform X2 n=1 Tax=Portunus trituberculatus TaxID=210409 RepID=UPI001E1CF1D9|nr:uncharacterized protein LOC123500024 isoform X2 [Portunus trituberculatus]
MQPCQATVCKAKQVCKYVKQRTKPTKTGRSTHLSGRGRKMETKIKLLGDPHVTENQKNSSQEREQMFDGNEVRGMCTVLRRHKLLVGAVVLVVVLASVGACVFLVSSSSILHHLGFTSKGIAKKSFASRLMSSTSQANNHTVPQDSWVSWLQKVGQKGATAEDEAYFAAGGAIVGLVVASAVIVVVQVVMVTWMAYHVWRNRH